MVFFWYPKCSTCRRAKAYLDGLGIDYEARLIAEERPTEEEMRAFYQKSGLALKKFFNTSGQVYRGLGLKDKLPGMSEDEQLALLASDGMLVKRPLLVDEDFVLVGFHEAEWDAKLK